jgi:hypothetical protein
MISASIGSIGSSDLSVSALDSFNGRGISCGPVRSVIMFNVAMASPTNKALCSSK